MRSRGRPLPPNAWRWFLAFEAVLALIYFPFGFPSGKGLILGVIPWMEWPGQVPAWALMGLSAVAAVVYGNFRYRPRAPLAWAFMGFGVLLFIAGDTIYKTGNQLLHVNIPFPSFIDAIYITMYPVLAAGLLLLARRRSSGGDQASLLDGLIVTMGIGLLSWVFLIGPNMRASGSTLVRMTAAAYPLGDVLVLAMLAHLWSSGGLRNAAGRLLALGTCGTLVADSIYGLANLHSTWNDGNPVDIGWILFYSCWGAAALHPSMRELSDRVPSTPHHTSYARLTLLGAVSLTAPVVLLLEDFRGTTVDAPSIAGVAAAMFLLVVMRMAGVVTAHQKAVTREQVLRREAAALVAAPDTASIYEATVRAVKELIGDQAGVFCASLAVPGLEDGLAIISSTAQGYAGELLDLSGLTPREKERFAGGRAVRHSQTVPPGPFGVAPAGRNLFLSPVMTSGQLKAVVLVHSFEELPPDLTNVLETLASHVGLALDREELNEISHVRRSEARFQTLVQSASDVILIAKPDTTITWQTQSAQRVLGFGPGTLEGTKFTSLLHPSDRERALAAYAGFAMRSGSSNMAEWRVVHADGSCRDVEVVANNLMADPTVEGIVLTLRDVTERKSLEDELKHQAFHDALSGLANRALFTDRLDHALARASRSLSSLAVLFIDLDDFKLVNDTLGHAAGDQLLVAVANRLQGSLRSGDTAARFGGDEFAILLEETPDREDARQAAERILLDLKAPFQVQDRVVTVYASIGIAYSKLGEEGPAEILQAADVAMYAAKARGKNCYETYKPALQAAVSERLERTADLQRAVEQGEFVLHYQPIVSLDGSGSVGVEALVRWQHPTEGMKQPNEFIPLAEETGLVIPMGRWVLSEACRQAAQWQRDHDMEGKIRVSVNISARHFQHDGLLGDVSRALQEANLPASCLVLEITESLLVHDAEAVIARMYEMKKLGVAFAVDDFGTGYSSLSYLQRFPIDILKVDKSFVDDVGDSERALALAKAIVQLGKSLNLDTVAEGIERAGQADGLRGLGCRYGQGFLFAKPVAAAEIDALLPLMASGGLVNTMAEAQGDPSA
jgi:diguanylate cyclase (GGDEF)-like protein/PAS domain S-box-containing protein